VSVYAANVITGTEEQFTRLFGGVNFLEEGICVHCPRRVMKIRRQGRAFDDVRPVFPGYIFVETNEGCGIEPHKFLFRHARGFCRFLPSNKDIRELFGSDLETVGHFLFKVGPVAGKSRVFFDEQQRIVVKDGPLLGLEGKIIKVDRRKGRARVKLDLYKDSFAIDLAIEALAAG
jgi:transcriptional antiterminator NusG